MLDVVVIGAGHAGLAISYLLKQRGLTHVVFERGRIGETWLSQRWDTFTLNSPNKVNVLPGTSYSGTNPEGFDTGQSFARQLQDYARSFELPVREGVQVIAVEKTGDHFTTTVRENGTTQKYESAQVVVASGNQNTKRVPSFTTNISPEVLQLHTLEYRSAAQLPAGAVLVAGSAQSGVQIAEDLLEAGRNVFLASSMVGRMPRRYRGRDIIDWLAETGFFKMPTSAADAKTLAMRVPQISGVGERGHTVSLQSLARDGAIILGSIETADSDTIYLRPNAKDHVAFADGVSKMVSGLIDEFIAKQAIAAPPQEEDLNDIPDPQALCASEITTLNLKEHSITSIVWATGFGGDFSYLQVPVLDELGAPKHANGIADVPGLYFLGFPWLRMRKSGMVFGIQDDAEFIADSIGQFHTRSIDRA